MIWGSTLIANEVGPMIFEAFLPAALAEARFVAAPSPTVMGAGLSAIPAALERQRQGVSAAKLVVTLCAPAETVVSVTRFRLRSLRFLPFFTLHMNRTIAHTRKAEGFVAGAVRREAERAFWTMTVWRDEHAMRRTAPAAPTEKRRPISLSGATRLAFVIGPNTAANSPNGPRPSVACARSGGR
jgi:hypothetical protein